MKVKEEEVKETREKVKKKTRLIALDLPSWCRLSDKETQKKESRIMGD